MNLRGCKPPNPHDFGQFPRQVSVVCYVLAFPFP
jgi:hypothetical protein